MKQFGILSILTLSFLLLSLNGNAQTKTSKSAVKVQVIDFHSTHRCATCNAIEANTKYTLNTYFAKELKSGQVTFLSINVDKDENYEMAEKYEASGTSLFLNVVTAEKESIINLTDFAFLRGRDKEAFSEELKVKIDKQLKKY